MELNKSWCGEIPESFEKKRFKYCYSYSHAGAVIDKSWWHKGNELLYTCQETPMMSNYDKFPPELRTKEKDILVTRNANPYIFIPEVGSIYSNVVQKLTIKTDEFSIPYLRYVLICATESVKVNGDTIPSWNMGVWDNLYLPIPSKKMQELIVSVLDRKVELIDKLIECAKSQILELQLRVDSLISEEIFLNHLDTYKDTNKKWLSKVNKGWELKKFKHVFSISKGLGITKADLTPEGIPVISYGQTHNSKFIYNFSQNINDLPRVPEKYLEFNNCIMNKGDFIFVDTSEDIKGSADFSLHSTDDVCFAGYHSLLAKPKERINSRFFMYQFRSSIWSHQIKSSVDGVKVYSITQRILGDVELVVPSVEEQELIVGKLDAVVSKYDELIKAKTAKIEELNNYKKSLIYEYVTGKKEVA